VNRPILALLLPALLASAGLGAQQPPATQSQAGRRELVGVVRDANGAALEGAVVEVGKASARTNARGTFQLFTGDVDTVTILIRAVGFQPIEAQIAARGRQWDTVMVQMERAAQGLDKVTVEESRYTRAFGMQGFEERRAKGIGVFVTREEILARNTTRTSEVLRLKRGVNVVQDKVRFVAATGQRGTICQPDVWLDGTRMRGMEVNDVTATDIEGIELYSNIASVPTEFAPLAVGSRMCGTIVIWTRTPAARNR
jgi:hypothetical protein